ncbi:MAG TPA: succinate dehydrogenase, cytochrome b556 subunit [Acidimicrobiales bacterium]|nr:succinate dehydrogenase, cytochrome b556 subunit [Acidimicrobiales bacterium]
MSTVGTPYRGKSGQWAFISHRVSGFLVFMFLMLHVVDVSLVQDKHLYNEVHAVYGNVVLRVFEVGLLFALVFHALNGLRIILIDFFPDAIRRDKTLFAVVVFITLAAGIPGAYIILRPFIEGHF